MTRFLVKKIFIFLVSLYMVATLTFVLMQLIPGDPFTQEKAVPEEILKAMYHHYGLDQPWYVQYGRYLKGLITCDLGPSFKYQGRTVTEIIREGFPVSLTLGLEALFLSIFCGVGCGCIAALKHLKWQDHLTMVIAVLGISVPSFIFCHLFAILDLDEARSLAGG
jgi:oligopeptide transport system permease protein